MGPATTHFIQFTMFFGISSNNKSKKDACNV